MTRAAVAILQKEKKILVCQRKRTSRYGLKWEFPGGKVENGESLLQCIKREVMEEISVRIDDAGRSESHLSRYEDGGEFEVTYYFVLRFSGTPTNNAFEQIRWVTLDELKNLDILEGNRPIVEKMDDSIFV